MKCNYKHAILYCYGCRDYNTKHGTNDYVNTPCIQINNKQFDYSKDVPAPNDFVPNKNDETTMSCEPRTVWEYWREV